MRRLHELRQRQSGRDFADPRPPHRWRVRFARASPSCRVPCARRAGVEAGVHCASAAQRWGGGPSRMGTDGPAQAWCLECGDAVDRCARRSCRCYPHSTHRGSPTRARFATIGTVLAAAALPPPPPRGGRRGTWTGGRPFRPPAPPPRSPPLLFFFIPLQGQRGLTPPGRARRWEAAVAATRAVAGHGAGAS